MENPPNEIFVNAIIKHRYTDEKEESVVLRKFESTGIWEFENGYELDDNYDVISWEIKK